MASIVALIPARSGSKGVPDKNIKDLGGHLVLEWSIASCLKSNRIQKTIVSTDSQKYASLAKTFGAEVPFLRPTEISGDRSTDYEFIDHALSWLEDNEELPKYIVHIRPSTPFRDPKLIDQAILNFTSQTTANALRSVHAMSESAYKTFEIVCGERLKRVGSESTELDEANNARQAFPNTYVANGYVDVLSVEFIRKSGLIHGDFVMPFLTPVVDEIDTEEDFERLASMIAINPGISSLVFQSN